MIPLFVICLISGSEFAFSCSPSSCFESIWLEFTEGGHTLIINGTSFNSTWAVTVTVRAPNGNILAIDQITPDRYDGSFTSTIGIGGPMWKQDGFYSIYLTQTKGVEDIFRIKIIDGAIAPNNEQTYLVLTPNTIRNPDGSTSNPPTSNPPTSNPPTSNPPTSNPPTSNPPTSNPPTSNQQNQNYNGLAQLVIFAIIVLIAIPILIKKLYNSRKKSKTQSKNEDYEEKYQEYVSKDDVDDTPAFGKIRNKLSGIYCKHCQIHIPVNESCYEILNSKDGVVNSRIHESCLFDYRKNLNQKITESAPFDPYAELVKFWDGADLATKETICNEIQIDLKISELKFNEIEDDTIKSKLLSRFYLRRAQEQERLKDEAEQRAKDEETKRKQADAKASEAEIGKRDAERVANEAQLQKERERVRADEAEFNVNYWKEQAAKAASSSNVNQNIPPYSGQTGKFLNIRQVFDKCEEENSPKNPDHIVNISEIIVTVEEKSNSTNVNDPYNPGEFVKNCHAKLRDHTGVINATLWEPFSEELQNDDEISIKGCYVKIWRGEYDFQISEKFGGTVNPVKIEQKRARDTLNSKKLDILDYKRHPLYRPETPNSSKPDRFTDKKLDKLIDEFTKAGYHQEQYEGQFENELRILELIILTEFLFRSKEEIKSEEKQEQRQEYERQEKKYEKQRSSKKEYYDILGVSVNSTQDEIKVAYRKLSLKWHPDRHPEDPTFSEEMMKKINEAYSVLKDPTKRKEYDRK